MHIPQYIIKDKQAFTKGMRMAGKPIDMAKKLKGETELLHLVDSDALKGMPTNLDVYNSLTFVINVQVECAPKEEIVKKLLSLKCRVVLPPSFDTSNLKEKKLLVAKFGKDYDGKADGFHDVIIEDADDGSVERFSSYGKRVMVYEADYQLLKKTKKLVWGVISSS